MVYWFSVRPPFSSDMKVELLDELCEEETVVALNANFGAGARLSEPVVVREPFVLKDFARSFGTVE